MESQAERISDRIQMLTGSVVLVANEVNVSIFKLAWLLDQGVIEKDELTDDVTITEVSTQVRTATYELTVVPNRIQLNFQPSEVGVESVLIRLLRILPHTPITVMGRNISYLMMAPQEEDFFVWTKKLFSPRVELSAIPIEELTSRFGTYASWDALGSRLKLDIKPCIAKGEHGESLEFMRFGFNYHKDLPEHRPIEEAIDLIEKWDELKRHSMSVVDEFERFKGEAHGC